nr:hypothetical protein [Pandoravirus massiliensis]
MNGAAQQGQRPAGDGAPSPWDIETDVAALSAMCDRAALGSADYDDLRELLRLSSGAMTSGTTHARLADGNALTPCNILTGSYRDLWTALAGDREALDAVRRTSNVWPPTFVDVRRAYMGVEPESADLQMAVLDAQASATPQRATGRLVTAVGDASRRSAAVAARAEGLALGFPTPLPPEWQAFVDAHRASIEGCDPRNRYFILASDGDGVSRAGLFWMPSGDPDSEPQSAKVIDCAVVYMPRGRSPRRYEDFCSLGRRTVRLPHALVPYEPELPLFTRAVADAPRRYAYEDSPLTSGGGLWVADALVPLSSVFDVPKELRDTIHYLARNDAGKEWFDHPMRGMWIDECQLLVALHLVGGRLAAVRAAPLFYPPRTLVDAAAAAYVGPLSMDVMPAEILDRAAAYAWQRTCSAEPLPSGRLPHAENLLDVARVWGVGLSPLSIDKPETLCRSLAGPAVAAAAVARYGVAPAPLSDRGNRPTEGGRELWARMCALPPGAQADPGDLPRMRFISSRSDVTLEPGDDGDPGHFCGRLARYMTAP